MVLSRANASPRLYAFSSEIARGSRLESPCAHAEIALISSYDGFTLKSPLSTAARHCFTTCAVSPRSGFVEPHKTMSHTLTDTASACRVNTPSPAHAHAHAHAARLDGTSSALLTLHFYKKKSASPPASIQKYAIESIVNRRLGSLIIGPGGIPTSGSVSSGKTNISSNFQFVRQQSGIQAGNGGFQANVQGNTTLPIQMGEWITIAQTEDAQSSNASGVLSRSSEQGLGLGQSSLRVEMRVTVK
jgi:hypothetical protein